MNQTAWEQAQNRQRNTVRLAVRELFNLADQYPNMTIEQFGLIYQAIVDKYGAVSASVALNAIENSRRAAGYWGTLPEPGPADMVSIEQTEATFSWAVNRSEGDIRSISRQLVGPLGRLVQQRGRHTVWNATVAAHTRYARLPGPKACAFCLMLASRGAVYTKETVLTTRGGRGKRPEGLRFHDRCDCTAIEAYSIDDLPQAIIDLRDEWYQATYRADGQPKANQFKAWKEYIAQTRPNNETAKPPRLAKKLKKSEDWLPKDATRVPASPLKNRGRHQVLSVKDIQELGLFKTKSTDPETKRNKTDKAVFEKEQRVIDWLKSRGATVERVGRLSEIGSEGNSPDIVVQNRTADIKTPESIRGIHGNARRGAQQTTQLIYDVRPLDVENTEVVESIKHAVRDYGDRLSRIVVIARDACFVWEEN